MLQSHKKSVGAICEVIDLSERDLSEETTTATFMRKLDRYLKYLTILKLASVLMQKHLATLDDCQFQCDTITKLAEERRNVSWHDFEHCKIELGKFKVGNTYDSSAAFIRAVIKVQQKKEDSLEEDEAWALQPWLIDIEEPSQNEEVVVRGTETRFKAINREWQEQPDEKKKN